MNQNKNPLVTPIVFFSLSVLSVIALIVTLFMDFYASDIIVGAIWTIGFAVLGIISLTKPVKSLGWLGGSVFFLGASVSKLFETIENGFEPMLLTFVALTIVFALFFFERNRK